tara:strand:- start:21526 stop:22140 length:615 start_codon:yes stop_codon:yes gene_type:complete
LEEKAVHDFIEVYPRMLSPKFCMDLINYGKKVWLDSTRTGQNKMVRKKKITDDNQVMLAPNLNNLLPMELYNPLRESISKCLSMYSEKYWILQEMHPLHTFTYKFHWVKAGGGYHVWHTENMGEDSQLRQLVFHLCLNDTQEEGSLEFLNYTKQVYPKPGTITLWPSQFTHAHRGNPMKTREKFYITGWFYYYEPPSNKCGGCK